MSTSNLTPVQVELIERATATFSHVRPHSPTSRRTTDHTCAAAALASDGRVFTGVNMFHYSSGLCAENSVMAKAAEAGIGSALNPGTLTSEGAEEPARLVLIVAVLNEGRGVVSPCGRCRQVLLDYHPWIDVLVLDAERDEVQAVPVKDLLPFAWVPRWA